MAAQMVVSTNTIKSHMRAVLRKFDVHSRSELRLLLSDFNFDNWTNPLYPPASPSWRSAQYFPIHISRTTAQSVKAESIYLQLLCWR
jgi:hypothetical protein